MITSMQPNKAWGDHGDLAGLSDDDHSQYLLLAGRAGGQVAIGGTLTTQLLTLQDNVVDGNQITLGPGLLNGLLDGQTGQHDAQFRHIGVGINAAGNGHLILGAELFSGLGNKVGVGMFPALLSAAGVASLYGVQGNVFFGGSTWSAGSNINALQFYPAPDYLNGAVAWGNTNLNLIGITTGGCINIFGRTISCNALLGISVGTLAHIFGAPGAVSANRATAIEVLTPSQTTGTIVLQTGIEIQPQLYGTLNQGLWLSGDNSVVIPPLGGSDIVFGAGKDARIYYDGSNFVLDPDFAGSGRLYIGVTGDDDMLLNDIEIDGDLNHDGTLIGFFGTAPVVQQTNAAGAAGHAAVGGANVNANDTFTGGAGAGYSVDDVVQALKNYGLLTP